MLAEAVQILINSLGSLAEYLLLLLPESPLMNFVKDKFLDKRKDIKMKHKKAHFSLFLKVCVLLKLKT